MSNQILHVHLIELIQFSVFVIGFQFDLIWIYESLQYLCRLQDFRLMHHAPDFPHGYWMALVALAVTASLTALTDSHLYSWVESGSQD